MSLRHALLGLLADEPAGGYDVSRAFAGEFGRDAWQAGHTRIHPEFVRPEELGPVTVPALGPRGRTTWAVRPRRVELRTRTPVRRRPAPARWRSA